MIYEYRIRFLLIEIALVCIKMSAFIFNFHFFYFIHSVSKYNRKIAETKTKSIPLTHTCTHDHSLSWFHTGTSIQSGGAKLVLSMIWSCKWFLLHVSKMPPLAYKKARGHSFACIRLYDDTIYTVCGITVNFIRLDYIQKQ